MSRLSLLAHVTKASGVRPPFAYYGGKVGLARRIVELMPAHDSYLEPFFGSGAVLFAKQPSRHEIVNDADGDIVNFFEVLRNAPEELEAVCRLTPYARDEWAAADLEAQDLDAVERARRFWVRVNQSFAKTHRSTTGWSITTARTQSPPNSVLGRVARFRAVADRLMSVTIENTDAIGLLDRFGDDPTVVIYADPPYVHSTRRSGRRWQAKDYTHEMSEDDHIALAEVLNGVSATVILSGYPSELYDELYVGWWQHDYAVQVHSSNALTASREGRTERIWMNRTPAHNLFSQEVS